MCIFFIWHSVSHVVLYILNSFLSQERQPQSWQSVITEIVSCSQ